MKSDSGVQKFTQTSFVESTTQKVWNRFRTPSTDELKNYGEETTLHGLKYVFRSDRHNCERIFWTISFFSGIVMAIFLIYGVCTSYLKNPVVVTFQVDETMISGIPFPAVTICNTNRVRKSVAEGIIKNAREAARLALSPSETEGKEKNESLKFHLKKLKCIDFACQVSQLFMSPKDSVENSSLYDMFLEEIGDTNGDLRLATDINEKEINDVRESAAHPCDKIALLCRWADKEYNCSELFSVVLTNQGYCCAFNLIPGTTVVDLNNMFDNAAKESAWGKDSSKFESLIGTATQDATSRILLENIAKVRTQQRAGIDEGLSIVLNPQLEEYFCSSTNGPGFIFKTHLPVDSPFGIITPIPLKTEMFVTMIPEAIFADTDIKGFNTEKRKCYFEGEYRLKVFKTYTREHCIVECEGGLLEELCGCRRVSIDPTKNNTCGPDDQLCVATAFERITSKTAAERCSYCFPTCNDLRYIQNIITSPISDGNSKFHTGKPREYFKDWVNKSASILHVYLDQDLYYARERKQLYSLTDLIANIGGLLGLCLGFSGLSLIEMVYFFSIRPCFNRRGDVSPEPEKASHEDIDISML